MNGHLVDSWLITGKDRRIFSAHCLGCKAGLAEPCTHVASVLFYIACWTRIKKKLARTQVKCSWLLPTYVSNVTCARAKEIDFSSAKKLKEKLDNHTESFDGYSNQTRTTYNRVQTTQPFSYPQNTSNTK